MALENFHYFARKLMDQVGFLNIKHKTNVSEMFYARILSSVLALRCMEVARLVCVHMCTQALKQAGSERL